jgi:hypothetical protein
MLIGELFPTAFEIKQKSMLCDKIHNMDFCFSESYSCPSNSPPSDLFPAHFLKVHFFINYII